MANHLGFRLTPRTGVRKQKSRVCTSWVVMAGLTGWEWRREMNFPTIRLKKKTISTSRLPSCVLFLLDPNSSWTRNLESVRVAVRIERGGEILWSKTFFSGEAEMCHSLKNIEH